MSKEDKYGSWTSYTSGCFCADKGTSFEVSAVNDSVGIDVNIDTNTIIHLTLSVAQAEVLADVLCEYLDSLAKVVMTDA